MATLDDVIASVKDEDTVIDSVVTLLTDIKTKLDAAGQDPIKLADLSSSIAAQKQRLADAVVANTPTI